MTDDTKVVRVSGLGVPPVSLLKTNSTFFLLQAPKCWTSQKGNNQNLPVLPNQYLTVTLNWLIRNECRTLKERKTTTMSRLNKLTSTLNVPLRSETVAFWKIIKNWSRKDTQTLTSSCLETRDLTADRPCPLYFLPCYVRTFIPDVRVLFFRFLSLDGLSWSGKHTHEHFSSKAWKMLLCVRAPIPHLSS